MSVSELSASTQNYLKAVWGLTEWSSVPVTPTLIAERTGLKLSSVSDAVRKLSTQGLVEHAPYGSVELTETGRSYALAMVRRHRLIESFLVSVLGYSWDQVHDEAEHLEHAVSDFMIDRIDEFLEFPTRDPHGDPIPSADGTVQIPDATQLTGVGAGHRVVFAHLDGSAEVIAERLEGRQGHFMPASLLQSQIDTLEDLEPDEDGVVLDLTAAPEVLVDQVMASVAPGR